jgi:hypothetical protein
MTKAVNALPTIIAGPILRHVSQDSLTLWIVTSSPITDSSQNQITHENGTDSVIVNVFDDTSKQISIKKGSVELIQYQVGEHCFISTVVVEQSALLESDRVYYYDVHLNTHNDSLIILSQACEDMRYADQEYFSFKFSQKLKRVLHGSCRKAHYAGKDALPQLDGLIKQSIENKDSSTRPDLMLFTGDQVYVDDVAGPMLSAIQNVIDRLKLFHECFDGSTISCSSELFTHPDGFYRREHLLPKTKANKDLFESFFKGKEKPVFTSVNARNHLIAFNEIIALYLLSWSSRLWPLVSFDKADLAEEYRQQYANEAQRLRDFANGLPEVERAMAHVPIYMIFDDHDVTDDWNLTRGWEEQAYANPFSKRIIGNAIAGYFVCQGMGNPKSTWQALVPEALKHFSSVEQLNAQQQLEHSEFIDRLFEHNQWNYNLDTLPPVQVLDTRTQRWRSESNRNKPSGLMDWEGLCDLQQDIIGKESVIMVSAAPVYGVKFIEAIQRVFITFGGALVVDAENWMAHRGTASVMLNIFRHIKTPPNFIILSGDVHYSFVYDVSLRFRRNSPQIIQFTCSGIHNQFPDKLIKWFERFNRWLYGHRSPLNWLTKRRNMSIKERNAHYEKPPTSAIGEGKDIVNASSIGLLELDENGNELACKLILADGSLVTFNQSS